MNTGQTTVSDNPEEVSVSGELALLADRLQCLYLTMQLWQPSSRRNPLK